VPNILILIPSFDNKHIINLIVYIGFDVYAQKMSRGVLGRKKHINT